MFLWRRKCFSTWRPYFYRIAFSPSSVRVCACVNSLSLQFHILFTGKSSYTQRAFRRLRKKYGVELQQGDLSNVFITVGDVSVEESAARFVQGMQGNQDWQG